MKASYRKVRASSDKIEVRCDACNGTGFPRVTQPVEPGRKLYPAPCKRCGGKGRILKTAE